LSQDAKKRGFIDRFEVGEVQQKEKSVRYVNFASYPPHKTCFLQQFEEISSFKQHLLNSINVYLLVLNYLDK